MRAVLKVIGNKKRIGSGDEITRWMQIKEAVRILEKIKKNIGKLGIMKEGF